jgi:succinate-semialdehyde dehydrogenase/glutarate-semialdehyde dehydrogenase
VKYRARIIRAVSPIVAERAEQLTETICAASGKPRVDALGTELLTATLVCRYYPRLARRTLKPKGIRGGSILFFNKRSRLVREPYGVIGIIGPWNYPLGIPMHEIVQALLAGNTVVLKVATQSQTVGEAIVDLFRDAGLPEGVLNLVHLPGSAAGRAFIRSGIDKLLFTGTTEVGRSLIAQAADRLLPLSLELGGNDPMIVLRDASLPRAVDLDQGSQSRPGIGKAASGRGGDDQRSPDESRHAGNTLGRLQIIQFRMLSRGAGILRSNPGQGRGG